jgi:endoglucanase
MTDFRSVWVVMSLAALAFAGCKPKIDPLSSATQEMPEGKACGPDGVISDGENSPNQVNVVKGRGGYWYTFADDGSNITPMTGKKGGTFAMEPGGANGTKMAAHMVGSVGGADIVYAGMGMNFVDPKGQYDASAYQGISFWGKRGPGSSGNLRLKVPDVATEPDGGMCSECFNDFGADLTFADNWQKFTIPFSAMKQLKGWGNPHTSGIDKSKLYGIQFQVNEKNAKFDIWVDEIQFTGCP